MNRRGFSLLEAGIAFVLILGILASMLLFFSSLFGRHQRAEVQQDAVSALEAVSAIFRERARSLWPAPVSVGRDEYSGYAYHVDDLGMLVNPLDSQASVAVKELSISVYYPTPSGEKFYSTRLWVGK